MNEFSTNSDALELPRPEEVTPPQQPVDQDEHRETPWPGLRRTTARMPLFRT